MKRVLGILTLTLSAPLAGQATDVTAPLAGRVPAPVLQAVRALADSAALLGVPAAPLAQKALEGAAKGVAPDRVIAALHTLLGREVTARDALRRGGVESPAGADIEGATFALNTGLADSDVSAIVRAGGSAYAPATTLRVAGTLAALGVPAAGTVQLVSTELAAGVSVGDLGTLPGSVESALAHGMSPAQAAAGLARAQGHVNGNNGQGKAKGRGKGPKS